MSQSYFCKVSDNPRSVQLVPEEAPAAPPSMVEKAAVESPARSSMDNGKTHKNKRKLPETIRSSSAAATMLPATNLLNQSRFRLGGMRKVPLPLAAAAPPPVTLVEAEQRGILLVKLLQSTAAALAEGKIAQVDTGLEKISSLASPDGDALQRVATAFAEALALRLLLPTEGVCRALQIPQVVPAKAVAAARQKFRALCPFGRIAGAAANLSIVEAMRSEMDVVHVVDLGGADPDQWLELLRLFAARPGGAPRLLRLTVVNERNEFLSAAAAFLTAEAQRLRSNFQFEPVQSSVDELSGIEALGVIGDQALAVVSTLQMHRLLAYEVAAACPNGRRGKEPAARYRHTMTRADALLRAIRGLSPKLMILTEQEADHNTDELTTRFWNALNYYAALFDAVAAYAAPVGSPASPLDRACVERQLLREEIRDIVALDGAARRERHERAERWASRMDAAGFAPVVIRNVLAQTEKIAQQLSASGGAGAGAGSSTAACRVVKAHGCFSLICWYAVPILSVSTWMARRIVLRPTAPWPATGGSSSGRDRQSDLIF